MYSIGLLFVFLISAYIYDRYLPYFGDFDENIFLLLICIFYSILYCLFNYLTFKMSIKMY